MSKFKALKEILEGVAPTVAKEGEEAAASALAKEAEEAAAREAFKAEFNLPVAHGTNLERTGDEIIEEFIPSNSPQMTYGEGIYTGIIHPNKSPTSNRYTLGSKGGFNVPLRVRGNKIFNLYDRTLHDRFPHLKGIIPTVDESYQKLSNLHVGHPQLANALERIYARDGVKGIEEYIRQYPEHFEGILAEPDTGIVKLFEPKNVRLPWARFDPKKRNSGNTMDSIVAATTGAGAYSALSPESAEASEASSKMPTKEEMLKDYVAIRRWPETPREESKAAEDRRLAKERTEDFEKNISEDIGPIGSLGYNLTKGLLFDERPPEEFEEGGGGITEPIVSPIDFITPGMVAAPAKALGRGALTAGKAGLEAVESGAQALAKRYPELAKRLADNRGSIDLSKKASEYMVPGPWQESRYKRITEELPIEFLEKYKGNALGKTDIEALKKSIQEEGLKEPLILSFDPDTKRIKLGEGNHRLEALRQLGYTHAPVRASRSYVEDPTFPQVLIKPSTDRIDPSYYPADIKPSDIIDFEKLLKSKK